MPFLDYAHELGIGVFVPFSNWFLQGGWHNHTEKVTQLLEGVTTESGEIHPAIFGWIVGNEYDETPDETPIENVIDLLLTVASLDPDESYSRPFTIPSSTQAGYDGNLDPGLGQITEIREALLERAPDIYYNRFINAINPFMPFTPGMVQLILDPYVQLYEEWGESPLPLMFTETGLSQKDKDLKGKFGPLNGPLGELGMATFEEQIVTGFLNLMRGKQHEVADGAAAANFIGYSFFEFQQEDWKGGGGVDMFYGLHTLGDNISPVLPTQKSRPFKCPSLPGQVASDTTYEVNAIKPVMAWKAIAALQTNPQYYDLFAKNSTKSKNQEVVIDCIVGAWNTSMPCKAYDASSSCQGYQIQTREILQQANMHGNSCPTNLSLLAPCTVSEICVSENYDITHAEMIRYSGIVAGVCLFLGFVAVIVLLVTKRRRTTVTPKENTVYGTIGEDSSLQQDMSQQHTLII
eukprot:CAMPEP_0117754614 /NCGR_PEP_ID=MMETSP0947-20121206/12927_1 /TAXON_ID=44440 /ORGANISM="Chattonella subsalsa, Strain CCMP2191" /LENGTH=462 /DNA_ID=CAMNT_0005573723 /DNA_START=403 /DNA_END=1791 /DNA_ORIENTATION=-